MKRRILSMIIALALCLSLLPGAARTAEECHVTIANTTGENPVTLEAGTK